VRENASDVPGGVQDYRRGCVDGHNPLISGTANAPLALGATILYTSGWQCFVVLCLGAWFRTSLLVGASFRSRLGELALYNNRSHS
jgi:hypothetical protein